MAKLWTKDFVFNTVINFLIFIVYYLFTVIMAEYSAQYLGATSSEAGLAVGLFIMAALPARIVTGMLIEKIGRKRMLFSGLLLFAAATVSYIFIGSVPFLYLTRIIQGFGWGAATTCTATIVAYIIPVSRRGEGIGYYALSNSLASAIGPWIGMNLYENFSFLAICYLSIFVLVLIFVMTAFLKVPQAAAEEQKTKDGTGRKKLDQVLELKVLPIASVGFFVYFSYSSIVGFLSPYSKELNLVQAGSVFFVVYSVSIVLSRMFTGKIFDRKGEKYVMYPSFLLFASGLFLISQAHTGFVLLLSAVFMGMGYGTFISSTQTIAINMVEENRKGLATSTFQAVCDMGIGVGPSIIGLLIPMAGYRNVYIVMGVIVLLAMLLYYIISINHKKRRAEEGL